MEPVAQKSLSLDEYNNLEEENSLRYEYHNGQVYAMAGGDPKHSLIASNMLGTLSNALLKKSCYVFNSDAKYYVASANKSLYPDVSVVCGQPQRSEKDKRALINPILLVEVLSESTAAYDKGLKFHTYGLLPSLCEYVLIEQDIQMVQTFYRKTPSDPWQMYWYSINEHDGHHEEVVLRSIHANIPLLSLYRGTEGL